MQIHPPDATPMTKAEYAGLISAAKQDMLAVDSVIQSSLESHVPTINQLSHYLVDSGGKRLRPVMVVLAARACGYEGTLHHQLAAIVEFIHTATLLHDDVVDQSAMRRGQATVNSMWGDNLSVLVGDFLYSRSFEMMVEVNDLRVMETLARATNVIAEGEVMQALNRHNPDVHEAGYLKVIAAKTAALFGASAQLGALISRTKEPVRSAMAEFGHNFGIAYQLIDDVLDFQGQSDEIGKNLGDDLAEGQPTLPLIHAMQHASPDNAALIRDVIANGGGELGKIFAVIESTGSIAYTSRLAESYCQSAKQALEQVPASGYREVLCDLAEFAVSRTF